MALHSLLQITIAAPEPEALSAFYSEINLVGNHRNWGTQVDADQIRIEEASFRQLIEARIACDDEADLSLAAERLAELGIKSNLSGARLTVPDPINKWRYVLEPRKRRISSKQELWPVNYPGEVNRRNLRSMVVTETELRPPRRLGHFVLGSHEPRKTTELALALGFV